MSRIILLAFTLKQWIVLTSVFIALLVPTTLHAQSTSDKLAGPGSTPAQLESDSQSKHRWSDWKTSLKDRTGLDFGFDLIGLGMVATESVGQNWAGTGVARLFAEWELTGRGTENTGSLIGKVDYRHALGPIPVKSFAGELGYSGVIGATYSDQRLRLTHLFWNQNFAQGRGAIYAGWLDVTDYVDAYALASPWQGFTNLQFQTGSGTIGGLPDAALGVAAGYFFKNNVYISAGIVDANGNARNPLAGFETYFGERETFKSIEVGWTTGPKARFFNSAHVTIWQQDARAEEGTSSGYGVSFHLSYVLGKHWLPFLRGGWADAGDAIYEAAFSGGFGYSKDPSKGLLGVGLGWSRPNKDTYGTVLEDQVTFEAFWMFELAKFIELTPNVQYIINPALNPNANSTVLFGLRFRAAF
jgi:porin